MTTPSSSSGLFRSLLIDENDPCFSLERPELQALFSTMTGGAWVKKYTNSGKPLRRHLYLTPSHDAVVYVSEKKRVEDCTMALSDLDGVYRGQHTSVFFAAKAGRHCIGVPSQHCLSLVSTSGTPRKSLDVEFQTEAEASAWHTGLSALLIAALVSVEDSETRALRRAFSHALKRLPRAAASSVSLEEGDESMPFPPPLSLLPLSSIKGLLPNTTLAHQEGRLLELLREEGEHISLPGLLRAFNSLRSEDRCDVAALFHNLLLKQQRSAGAAGLTPVTLLNFLHTHQGWDEATLEDATNLCKRWGDSRFGSPHKSTAISGRVGGGAELSPAPALAPPLVMTLPSFVAWMTSSFNSALSPITTALGACDMTAPLAHYWIAASHNTYLEGDQLVSASSTAPYLNALAKGCRCVELDVWDGISGGGSGGAGGAGAGVQPSSSSSYSSHLSSSSSSAFFEPIVTHGGTLTSRIPFRDVIHALAAHAFLSREEDCYPLILSLELHCSQPQQERVAEILKESFPGRLLTWEYLCEQERERERRRGWNAEEGSAFNPFLLSPSALRGKVLVKTKFKGDLSVALSTPLSPSTRTASALASTSGVPSSSSRSGWGGSEGALSTLPPSSATAAGGGGGGGGGGEGKGGAGALPHMPISPLSKSLTEVVYLRGVPWRTLLLPVNGVSESEGEGGGAIPIPLPTLHPSPTLPSSSSSSSLAAPPPPPHIIASVKESNLLALMRKSRSLAHLHSVTRSNLVRVYPGTFRVTSSNFNPTPFWCAGVQMTALNYQTNDIPLRIQKAWFQRNGRCGYVLKPLYLRCGSTTTTATTATSTSPSPTPLSSGSTSTATDAAAAAAFSAEFETGEGAPLPSHPPLLPPSSASSSSSSSSSSATHHHDMRVSLPPPGDARRTRTYSRTERLKDWVRSVERMAPPPSPRSSAANAAAAAAASLEQQSSSNGTGVVVVTEGASPTSPTSPSTTLPFSSLDMEGGVLSALLLPTPDAHAAPTPMTLHVTLLGVTHLPLSREHALVQWTLYIFGYPNDSCRVKVGGKPVLTPSQGECLWLEHSSSAAAAAAAAASSGGGGGGGGGEVEGVVEGKVRRGGAGVTFQLSHPELATLYLEAHEVGDMGSRPCGYAVLPIPCARRGYRCLNVRSPSGGKIPLCTLFLKLQMAAFPAPPLVK